MGANHSDPRIPYGAACTWWGRIWETRPKRFRVQDLPEKYRAVFQTRLADLVKLPSCPHCGGLLEEAPSLADWYASVDAYAIKESFPGYREVIDFGRDCGRCWPLDGEFGRGYEMLLLKFLEARWKKTRVERELGCDGYFGFGGGHEMARYKARESYCNAACPLSIACWNKHRERVRELFPAMSEEAARLVEAGRTGPEFVQEFVEKHGLMPPDVLVMTGNMEDGLAVALGGRPKDRGHATLPWPLKP